MDEERTAQGARYVTPRGVMLITRPAPHVQLISGHGHAEAAFAEPLLADRDAILREHKRIALFDDLEAVSSYESDIRVRLTAWARAHRAEIVAHHILVRSKLIAMGVSVATLALGGAITAHTRRATFDAALREIVRGAMSA